jgi:hypothetical protein
VDLELPPLTSAASALVASTFPVFEDRTFQPVTPYTSVAELEWGYVSNDQQQDGLGIKYETRLHSGSDIFCKIFAMGGREKLEEVVNGQLEDEAKRLCPESHPLERLEYILRLIENNDLPNYTYLSTQTDEVVQAVNYCKSLSQSLQLKCSPCHRQLAHISRLRRIRYPGPKSSAHAAPVGSTTHPPASNPPHTSLPLAQSLHP